MAENFVDVTRNLHDLSCKLSSANTHLLNASSEDVSNMLHVYGDLLNPWRSYLMEVLPQETEAAFECLQKIRRYDCTRNGLVSIMNELISKICELVNRLTIEKCTQAIKDAFAQVSSASDAIVLAAAIDETKNRCLAEIFNISK